MSYRRSLWLRADAVFDAGMGLLLLMASWDALYEALGLPLAAPPMYAQVAGGSSAATRTSSGPARRPLASAAWPGRPRS